MEIPSTVAQGVRKYEVVTGKGTGANVGTENSYTIPLTQNGEELLLEANFF